jgi:hypothetical protein
MTEAIAVVRAIPGGQVVSAPSLRQGHASQIAPASGRRYYLILVRQSSYRQESENIAHQVVGIDHVAITVENMEIACSFYERLFGAHTVFEYAPDNKVLVRQIAIGSTVLSIHQAGNGVELVAKRPTIGAADLCWHWDGAIESALALLNAHRIEWWKDRHHVEPPTNTTKT